MKGLLAAFFIFAPQLLRAEITLTPRYDLISGKRVLFNRGLIQSELAGKNRRFKFYADIFAEADGAPLESKEWRRAKDAAYLQEANIEYQRGAFFLKVGRQAARWSESWILPSLDVWTARRYERLFVDPLNLQLQHSTGLVMSIVQSKWSMDLADMVDVAQDTFPQPLPDRIEVVDKESFNPGMRFKFDLDGFQSTFVAARALRKNTLGYAASYAFEDWVPKVEFGRSYNDQINDFYIERNLYWGSGGFDLFLESWTFTPQVTVFQGEDPLSSARTQALSYLSVLYTKGPHEIQWQGFTNSIYNDSFWGALYTYTVKQKWAFSGLMQNYRGGGVTLTSKVQEETGGLLFGIRFQYSGSFF